MHHHTFVGVLLAVATLLLNYAVAQDPSLSVHIKSKESSGTGCPTDHWVSIVQMAPRTSYFDIEYREFTPQVTPQDLMRFGAQNCQVILELDQLPAGYQFTIQNVTHLAQAHFDKGESWRQGFTTDIQYNVDGLVDRAALYQTMGFHGRIHRLVTLQSLHVGSPVWSPCFVAGESMRLIINERVAFGWDGDQTDMRYAWFESGDFGAPYTGRYSLDWRQCF
ncbi:hypothetical protein F5882DRAFT_436388 [Hyaloscypha sp. PMI_1271]|nr:hypothetical protein F5882DRAFT_436388 [Hyaloscypha sp. PMI_1271]